MNVDLFRQKPLFLYLNNENAYDTHAHTRVCVFSSFNKDFNQRGFSVSECMDESCAWNRKREICD